MEVVINTNERLVLEFVCTETARIGQCRASTRHIATELNTEKKTIQRRLSALLKAGLIERMHAKGMGGSTTYRITHQGLAALEGLAASKIVLEGGHDSLSRMGKFDTWYRDAPVPDAMRSQGLRGPWELWISAPHGVWLSPLKSLPYVTVKTERSVRNWVNRLADLDISLAEWDKAKTRFQLLDADVRVFDQLRLIQEKEAAEQGRTLLAREDLKRSYWVQRIQAD